MKYKCVPQSISIKMRYTWRYTVIIVDGKAILLIVIAKIMDVTMTSKRTFSECDFQIYFPTFKKFMQICQVVWFQFHEI